MRKFLLIFGVLLISCAGAFAAKIPEEVREYVLNEFPQADIRFDGVIILPDNAVYLPLYPSLFTDIKSLEIKETRPLGRTFKQEPDVIIFNNDFVLLKVLTDVNGNKTVLHMTPPPLQVRTGLLPQDMLVPSGLIIPENIKGIIGNLKIDTKNEDIIRVENNDSYEHFLSQGEPAGKQALIPQLKNKTLFITTNYSKNIQVLDPAKAVPNYSLAQKSIPIDVKAVNHGKILLVTSYDRPFIDIISVADSRFIKQINLGSNPEEILIEKDKAYITSPAASTIFVLDLNTMSLTRKIKVNGYCENLIFQDGKFFYADKLKNEIWAIEPENSYELKDIGRFPNVSAIAFFENKIYIASRTKSRIAVVDYVTQGLINEFASAKKPVAMLLRNRVLYVLGAEDNVIQKIDADNGNIIGKTELNTGGFSKGLHKIEGTDLAVVFDIKKNNYSIIDLAQDKLLKTYTVNVPIKDIIITDKVKLFD